MKRYISHDQFCLFEMLINKLNLHYTLITITILLLPSNYILCIDAGNSLYYRDVTSVLQILKFFRISYSYGP